MKLSNLLPWALAASAVLPQMTSTTRRAGLSPEDRLKLELLEVTYPYASNVPVLSTTAHFQARNLIAGDKLPTTLSGKANVLIPPSSFGDFSVQGDRNIVSNVSGDVVGSGSLLVTTQFTADYLWAENSAAISCILQDASAGPNDALRWHGAKAIGGQVVGTPSQFNGSTWIEGVPQ